MSRSATHSARVAAHLLFNLPECPTRRDIVKALRIAEQAGYHRRERELRRDIAKNRMPRQAL